MSRWPLHKAYLWERAPFFRLVMPLILGIVLYDVAAQLSYQIVSTIAITSLVLFAISSFVRKQLTALNALRFLFMNLAVIALGWVLCYHNDIRNNEHWFGKQRAGAFVARIAKAPEEKPKTWKLVVDVIGSADGRRIKHSTGKAFVYVYKNADYQQLLQEGDTVMLPPNWQPVRNAGNPYEFNYAQYCARNNIYYMQFLSSDDIVLHNIAPAKISWIQRVHQWCLQQLVIYIKDRRTLGLIQAMLIGDEINLDAELRQAYSETGIVHIIAISGSHITFFFFLLSFLMGWLRHKKYHWLKYLAAIPLIWIYVLMAGAPPSAVRSAFMFTILSIGFALEKQPNMLNNLLATAFLLLCAEPMWLYAVGFQLSFLAVLSLILFYRPVYNWVKPTHIIARGLWSVIAASIAAELLIAPLVIYYFHLFPLLFIVANAVAYLFMGVVLVLGMLIVVLSSFTWLAGVIATVVTFLVAIFNELVYAMQKLNPASFRFLSLNGIELILLYVLIAAFAVWFIRQSKAAIFTALSAACVLTTCLCFDEYKALTQHKLVAYNILRADHVELIKGKQYTVLHSTVAGARQEAYILKPAHTGFNAWRPAGIKPQEIIYSKGRVVLLLDKELYNDSSFHTDDIIINYPARAKAINGIVEQYSPRRIILGNSIKHKELLAWADSCKARNISLHIISKDGAFIL